MKYLLTVFILVFASSLFAQPYLPLKPGEQLEYVEVEGYLENGFESSTLYLLNEHGELINDRMWVRYDNQKLDEYTILSHFLYERDRVYEGVYVKVGGMKKWGAFNYGHMGSCRSEINVSKIIDMDTTRTRLGHIKERTSKRGYHIIEKDTFHLPKVMTPGKQHLYKGTANGVQYELKATSADASNIDFTLKCSHKETMITLNSSLMISLYRLNIPQEYNDEHVTIAEYLNYDDCPVWIRLEFLKDKEGTQQVITLSLNGLVAIRGDSVKLYEVK